MRLGEYPCAVSRPEGAREGASGVPFRDGVTRANKSSGRILTRNGQGVPTPGSTPSPTLSIAWRCIFKSSRAIGERLVELRNAVVARDLEAAMGA